MFLSDVNPILTKFYVVRLLFRLFFAESVTVDFRFLFVRNGSSAIFFGSSSNQYSCHVLTEIIVKFPSSSGISAS